MGAPQIVEFREVWSCHDKFRTPLRLDCEVYDRIVVFLLDSNFASFRNRPVPVSKSNRTIITSRESLLVTEQGHLRYRTHWGVLLSVGDRIESLDKRV
jgi:hypothetical protein